MNIIECYQQCVTSFQSSCHYNWLLPLPLKAWLTLLALPLRPSALSPSFLVDVGVTWSASAACGERSSSIDSELHADDGPRLLLPPSSPAVNDIRCWLRLDRPHVSSECVSSCWRTDGDEHCFSSWSWPPPPPLVVTWKMRDPDGLWRTSAIVSWVET